MVNDEKKTTILHITPHLGGGVGSVLLNYLIYEKGCKNYSHSIATLDYANKKSIKISQEVGFELYSDMHTKINELFEIIKNADIILIHFWNHPLLYDFLVRNELPPSRVIFWAHISGFTPPYVFTEKVLNYPDKFIFTTPLSFNTNEVQGFSDKSKFSTIWSTGGVERVKNVEPKPHCGFNIGYIGTVDYSKMHPDFLDICSKIDIPDIKFIVCGGPKHLELKNKVEKMGIVDKFEFTGEVKDITKYLEIFDVFGYPLNPEHYGTCDQVLQEAMAAGIVPVTLNNPMENYILQSGKFGIVAKSQNDYVSAIEHLYQDKKLRADLALKAKTHSVSTFTLNKLSKDWNIVFNQILKTSKNHKKWEINNTRLSYFDIFLESLGGYKDLFMVKSEIDIDRIKKLSKLPNWQSETKGTVHQYFKFFNTDEKLKYLSNLMKGI